MISKIMIIFFFFSIKNMFSFIAYFKLEINCINDYPKDVITSERIVEPINQNTIPEGERDRYYIYYFPLMKHNFTNPICIQMFNYYRFGFFAFNKACINEYDITILNYEDYYYCDTCNAKIKKI